MIDPADHLEALGKSARRASASKRFPRGRGLLPRWRLEQPQGSGHPADWPVRVVGPENATIFGLGAAVSDAVAVRLAEHLAVAQPRRPGEHEIAEVDLLNEGLPRLDDL